MNLRQAPLPIVTSQERPDEAHTRLRGGLLVLARGAWIAGVVATVWLYVFELPKIYRQLQTVCVGATACPAGALSPAGVRTLHELGLSIGEYAAYILAFFVALELGWFAIGCVIFWRRSDDWMALLVSLFLVMSTTDTGISKSLPAFVYPVWDPPFQFVSYLASILSVFFFFLFPDGRFVPRWTRWCAVVMVVVAVPLYFFPNSPFNLNSWPGGLNVLVFVSFVGIFLFAQLYRYRRVSNQVQRQQTKWVVFGVTIALLVFLGGVLYSLIFPSFSQPGSLYSFAFTIALGMALLAIPLSIGLAVLRYRLWEIDVLINRTLVYGTLTVILTGVYVGLVIGLQAPLRGITNQGSGVAIVISTLAIYFLFQPLRSRIQRNIDRRFYRSKYDAAKIVAAFSVTLRQEVDLEQLREQLLTVVQETMQPTHVSLWLRPPEPSRKRKTWLLARSNEQERGEP
jgi:membrane protein YdbS with pleckstrin-like domain